LNSKKNKEIFQLFEQATKHAALVGNQLHRLIEKTSVASVTLIGHSLGAKVAVQFTPDVAVSKKYCVCLIAPALSAEEIKQLYQTLPEKAAINWHIVYNENDFVLKKKDNKIGVFGPGVKKYGATGLGCNYHNELLNLAAYIATNYPTVSIYLDNKTSIGKCHSLRCYTQANALAEVANFITQRD
jgi:alpha-beta hydrolase superfamily lysophospholipase